ncbi:MAG: ABC transporter ATP-binding protein [Promethearchaeota archaeon]|nr:MAG: ABC transporter ATP-binding protein [Candidatus Lokiarchaeota archaeon]
MHLIEFHNFYFRYKKNKEYQLHDINLKIDENKFILLCGQTGSGKTTLIRCLNGLIPQFYPGYYRGFVEVNGKDTAEASIADLSTEIGIVFQNPENQLISMNVEHEIAFGMENLGVPREEMEKRIKEVLKLTEIEHLVDKAPFELSGGEQQRVAIASILALEPKMLVLDEPTALLDPYMADKIITLLKKIQLERNMTILISEHRMDLVVPHSDEIILLDNARILEHGLRDEVINGENFLRLNINKPVLYSIFSELKNKRLYHENIPPSIDKAITYFKNIN